MGDRTASPKRRLWIGAAAAALAATAGFVYFQDGPASGRQDDPVDCEASKFSEKLEIAAVSPNGDYYAGRPSGQDEDVKAFGRWHDDDLEMIDIPESGFHEIVAVTDSGDVLGWDSYANTGWRYVDGEFQSLKAPKGSAMAKPNAMNAGGAVVGHTLDPESQQPLLWQPGEPQAKKLDLGGRTHGLAAGITDDGTIVGRTGDGVPPGFGMEGDSVIDAWRWNTDGTGSKLFDIKQLSYAKDVSLDGASEATAIVGDWILVTVDGDDQIRTRLSKPDAPEDVKVFAVALDDSGRAYGARKGEPAVHGEKVAGLPGLTAPPAPDSDETGELHNTITAVSADGTVIAGRTWKDKQILWRCE